LNSSGRDDIQTMDRQVFRVVVLRRNGTGNRVKMCCTVAGKKKISGSTFGGRCDTSGHFGGHVRSCGNVRIEPRWKSALRCAGTIRTYRTCGHTCIRYVQGRGKRARPTYIDWRVEKCTCRRRARRGINATGNELDRRIQNPWAGGKTIPDAFWIAGGRRHCSVFVLGPFCSISHGSTLRRKGWTNPTIHSQVFAFVLARGGCGRGASALPLNASVSSLTAREGAPFPA